MDALILGLTCLANFFLAAVVVMRRKNSKVEISFGLLVGFAIMWIIANYYANTSGHSLADTEIANSIAYGSTSLVLAAAVYFSFHFPLSRTISKTWLWSILAIFFVIIPLSFSEWIVGSVHLTESGVDFEEGQFVWVYTLFSLACIGLIMRNLLADYVHSSIKIRGQARNIAISLAISMLVVIFTNLLLPIITGDWSISRLGPLASIIFVATIAYTIVKHGLFDIRLAAVRTMAYIMALLSLAAIYYFVAYVVSHTLLKADTTSSFSTSPVNILLALVLAFIFQPVKRFFDRITNNIFYRDQYNTDDFFARLSGLLASTSDLRSVLERASNEIATTLKAKQAFFFLYYHNAVRHYVTAGTKDHGRIPAADAHVLDEYMKDNPHDVIMTDLLPEDSAVRRILISHKIELILPLRNSSKIIGYLCLGEQLRNNYSKRDMKVLATIKDELVIAIQNALRAHELYQANVHLEQRIKAATTELRESNAQLRRLDNAKDEFVSIASHQLRTPLTSIKGYISMMLDGDIGHVTENQRHVLNEAFKSSERMVGLINDFLSVSRLQTGKFVIEKREVDMGKVVEQEVGALKEIARAHSLALQYTKPHVPVLAEVDESKIRQIIMNLIDNSIFYSHSASDILVQLKHDEKGLEFTVTDTGIGVPAAEQSKLFTKFYRASNAKKQRPDGTGVGLYLVKRIINAHNGKMIFHSIEGKGSTFGFWVPLKDQQALDK